MCLLSDAAQPSTAGDNGVRVGNRTQVGNGEIHLELNSSSARQSLLQFDTHQVFFLGGGGRRVQVYRRRCVVCAHARVLVRLMLMRGEG